MEEKRLFLLDAYALIYRAYYALIRSPRMSSKGFNTSAIFGFCNTLDEVLRKENPDYIAVCFDPPGGHTFRHEIYPEYKAQRDRQPEDITLSIPYIKAILDAYRIKVIEMPGVEADDVIGSLSRMAEKEGFTTFMMTPDKDYGQLVTDKVFMYRPSLRGQDFEIRGPQEVCNRYGISSTNQVIDLLALEGDVSDNIPGCPGVGEKTAQKLIAEFGSVENLLDSVDKLKGAQKAKITENADKIRLSKYLATIKTDLDLGIDPEELKRQEPDVEKLASIFGELEFKTFLNRLGAKAPLGKTTAAKKQTPLTNQSEAGVLPFGFDDDEVCETSADPQTENATVPETSPLEINIVELSTPEEVSGFINSASETAGRDGSLGISLHASGDEAMTAELRGIAITGSQGKCGYVSLDEIGIRDEEIKVMLEPLFNNPSITLVCHDVKRAMILMRRKGIDFTSKYFDTSIAHYLLSPESSHDFSTISSNLLGYKTLDYNISGNEKKKRLAFENENYIPLHCEVAVIVQRLSSILTEKLKEKELYELFNDLEQPLIPVLADMEYTGVIIDTRQLAVLSTKLTARLHKLEDEAFEIAGQKFNIGSPMKVGEILFEKLKIDDKAKKTKKGSWSTTEEILEKYAREHRIVALILEIRGLKKLLATYIDALPKLVNPSTGRIHTTYNQTITATGRISSTNPNLQNIPIRTEDGREIRKAFIPSKGNVMVDADYSQIELRLMADLSGDRDMIEAFNSGEDIHRSTAAKIYHESLDEVTDNQRRNAKTANFGIIYGISAFGLSERLGIPRSEAKELIENYFKTYPGVKDYMASSIGKAREQKYVSTIMGRRRYLPEIDSANAVVRGYAERNAINAPLQGSAADIIKKAMIDIFNEFNRLGLKSKMIMQVHDELIFDVEPDELGIVQETVEKLMAGAYHGRVALETGMGSGADWFEAH